MCITNYFYITYHYFSYSQYEQYHEIITFITSMHIKIGDTDILVLILRILIYAAIKDQISDNLHYGIHHNLTKKCWFMLDFMFQLPFFNIHKLMIIRKLYIISYHHDQEFIIYIERLPWFIWRYYSYSLSYV